MEEFDQLVQMVDKARPDAEAFYKNGNQAAGTRLRAAMLAAREQAQKVRLDVSTVKSSKA